MPLIVSLPAWPVTVVRPRLTVTAALRRRRQSGSGWNNVITGKLNPAAAWASLHICASDSALALRSLALRLRFRSSLASPEFPTQS
jgi:hypothetical protein